MLLEKSMMVKREYAIGDSVWIYGVSVNNNRSVKGKVIKSIDLSAQGHLNGPYYIVEVPTHIEPLLEIRTWENMSQDESGPVGAFRELGNFDSTVKKIKTAGFHYDNSESDNEPTPDEIYAALEKSREDVMMKPLILKEQKPKRKMYYRKKKAQP